jgi:hypothetical protein
VVAGGTGSVGVVVVVGGGVVSVVGGGVVSVVGGGVVTEGIVSVTVSCGCVSVVCVVSWLHAAIAADSSCSTPWRRLSTSAASVSLGRLSMPSVTWLS